MGVVKSVLEAVIGTLKFKRGLKENLPTLQYGEPAYIYDENELYIGGKDGDTIVNKKLTCNAEVAEITASLNAKANTDDVFIKSEVLNGTMEIGKYIDFHSDDNKNTDFNGRLSHDNALKRFVAEHDSGINNKILEQRDIVNNLSTTQEGFILDARQGKLLYDMFGKLKFDTMVVNPNGQNSIIYTALAPLDRSIPLVLAQNGDTNVWSGFVTGVTVLDDTNISIGLNEARSGNIRINIFYKIK